MAYMNDLRHTTYQAPEWQTREIFVRLIDDICKEQGITRTWLSDSWIARLEYGGKACFVHGYIFPLNNASSAAIMRDKVATALVLQHDGIATIPHHLLRLDATQDIKDATSQALRLAPLPLVIKPNEGSGGNGVVMCTTKEDLAQAITELSSEYHSLAVSPLTAIQHEYRVIVQDGVAKLTYEKLRQPDAWHHNLKQGAAPQIITHAATKKEVEDFAARALTAIHGRLAAVDVVRTANGLQIMEINNGIIFNRFSLHSKEYAHIARDVYTDIIQACLN